MYDNNIHAPNIHAPNFSLCSIGLTGLIGSGKSLVANEFKNIGVPIIDTDVIARELTACNEDVIRQIKQVFGHHMFTQDGDLNRVAMRELVFANKKERLKLERILHPLILQTVLRQVRKHSSLRSGANDIHVSTVSNNAGNMSAHSGDEVTKKSINYVIIVVPLLFSSKEFLQLTNKNIFVSAPFIQIIDRVYRRSGLTKEQTIAIIDAQMPAEKQLAMADYVINNNADLLHLKKQVCRLHEIMSVYANNTINK